MPDTTSIRRVRFANGEKCAADDCEHRSHHYYDDDDDPGYCEGFTWCTDCLDWIHEAIWGERSRNGYMEIRATVEPAP